MRDGLVVVLVGALMGGGWACAPEPPAAGTAPVEVVPESGGGADRPEVTPLSVAVEVSPPRRVHRPGQAISLVARVEGAQGAAVRWEVTPPTLARQEASGRWRLLGEGTARFKACAIEEVLCGAAEVVIDAGVPVVELETPTPGEVLSGADHPQVIVAGRVQDTHHDGLVATLGGRPLALDPEGRFVALVDPATGINHIEVRAWDGVNPAPGVAAVEVLWAPRLLSPGDAPQGAWLRVGQAALGGSVEPDPEPGESGLALGSLGSLAAHLLDAQVGALALPAGGLIRPGTGWRPSSLRSGGAQVQARVEGEGVVLLAALPALELVAHVEQEETMGPGLASTTALLAAQAWLEVELAPGFDADGEPRVEVRRWLGAVEAVELQGDGASIGDVRALEVAVEIFLEEQVLTELGVAWGERAAHGLEALLGLSGGGALGLAPQGVEVAGGRWIELSLAAQVPAGVARRLPWRPSTLASPRPRLDPEAALQVGLPLDLLNTALAATWATGGVQRALAHVAPLRPVARMAPLLTPASPGDAGALRLTLGQLEATTTQGTVGMRLEVGVTLDWRREGLVLRAVGAPRVTAWPIGGLPQGSVEAARRWVEHRGAALVDELLAAPLGSGLASLDEALSGLPTWSGGLLEAVATTPPRVQQGWITLEARPVCSLRD